MRSQVNKSYQWRQIVLNSVILTNRLSRWYFQKGVQNTNVKIIFPTSSLLQVFSTVSVIHYESYSFIVLVAIVLLEIFNNDIKYKYIYYVDLTEKLFEKERGGTRICYFTHQMPTSLRLSQPKVRVQEQSCSPRLGAGAWLFQLALHSPNAHKPETEPARSQGPGTVLLSQVGCRRLVTPTSIATCKVLHLLER